ncbi:MAG: TRAP transporter small permease [Gammaproteobacteria bacterium]|nr:TRAP transporter small permease [Gammaproteobacteria bacterium]
MTDNPQTPNTLNRLNSALVKTEDWILVGILCSMLLIAVTQIVLRNFFGFGVIWAETLVRVLVLWTALIGAMVATRQSKHINIDIVSRYLSPKAKALVDAVVSLFTATVCLVIMYYSWVFVALEYQDGSLAFAHVPNWVCESIIPIAFMIMGTRYVITFVGDILQFTRKVT